MTADLKTRNRRFTQFSGQRTSIAPIARMTAGNDKNHKVLDRNNSNQTNLQNEKYSKESQMFTTAKEMKQTIPSGILDTLSDDRDATQSPTNNGLSFQTFQKCKFIKHNNNSRVRNQPNHKLEGARATSI